MASNRIRRSVLRTLAALALVSGCALPALAASGTHGKPGGRGVGGNPGRGGGVASDVFEPVLRRRDFGVGHAEVTESPEVTPQGQVVLDVGVGNVSVGSVDTLRARSLTLAPVGVAWGVAHRVDLRLDVGTWSDERVSHTTGIAPEVSDGFGDVHVRARSCLYGDDSSAVAVGLVIDARSPHHDPVTGTTRLDGGVILPASCDLPGDTKLSAMAEVDVRDDVAGDGRHLETVASTSVSHDLRHDLSGFAEFVSVRSAEAGVPWLGVVDGGVYWDATPWLSAGAGATLGVSDRADRGLFAGLSWHHRLR